MHILYSVIGKISIKFLHSSDAIIADIGRWKRLNFRHDADLEIKV